MKQVTLRYGLPVVCLLYIVMACVFASVNLDIDEFGFIRDPYELLGGDYTAGYLKQHRFRDAAETALKAYYFYWTYRPLYSPLIRESDKTMFQTQERDFGYAKPASVSKGDQEALAKYNRRLIVPEPDRFYSHGAGKPLLSAIASIPQLFLLQIVSPNGKNLLYYQYRYNYHAIFIVARLAQILAGLAVILIVYGILLREYDQTKALIGAAAVGLFPTAIEYFPNLHHDSILAPFLILSLYFFIKEHYKKAGLLFGLALATKNVAIFMLPVFAVQLLLNLIEAQRSSPQHSRDAVRRILAGPLKMAAISFLVLLPFANPISYASEILTPVTHRATDPRGENVEQSTLSGRLGSHGDQLTAAERPDVRFLQLMLRLQSNDFFFLAIAAALFYSTRQDRLMSLCFLFLLMSLPYGLIFGYGLNYRSLQFIPFFGLLIGRLMPKQCAIIFVSFLLMADVVYCIEPITANEGHVPINHDEFWPALFGR
jgi:Dolichyl-phosphate-mannose-protein mannosyltransferase